MWIATATSTNAWSSRRMAESSAKQVAQASTTPKSWSSVPPHIRSPRPSMRVTLSTTTAPESRLRVRARS